MIRAIVILILLARPLGAESPGELAQRGAFGEAAAGFLAEARAAERNGELPVATRALMNAVSCMKMSGDISAASLHTDTIRKWLGEKPDQELYLEWLALRGSVLALGKRPGEAVPLLKEALRLIGAGAGDEILAADVSNDLAIAQSATGDHAAAVATFEKAWPLLAKREGGVLRARQNHLVASFQAWRERMVLLERVREVGAWTGTLEEEVAEARRRLDASLSAALAEMPRDGSGGILAMHLRLTAGMAARRVGRNAEANALFGEALRLARASEASGFEASAMLGLAEQYQEAGRHREALQLLEATRPLEDRIGPGERARLEVLTAESRFALAPVDEGTGDAIRRAVAAVNSVRSDLARAQLVSDLGRGFREFSGRPYLLLADHLLRRARSGAESEQDLLRSARDAIEGFKTWELNDFYRDDCVNLALAQARNLDKLGDPRIAVLYVIPLDDRTEILVGHDTGLRRFRADLSGGELLALARRFRYHLESDYGTYRFYDEAEALHGHLIKPLRAHLKQLGIKQLVFVPDGSLGNIPLGALFNPDTERYLLEDFSISIAPNLSLLGQDEESEEPRPTLVGGLSESVQGFAALPAVKSELAKVAAIYPRSVVIENGDFTSWAVSQKLIELPVSVVHLASHGEFLGRAEGSFLLTHDGRISLDQLEQMIRPKKYIGTPVELLCLSACRTAAGDDRSALGLAGAAVKSGSRSVLATLWYVEDEATSEIMTNFHRNMVADPKASKAEALRRAQLLLLERDRNAHPNLWAPFVLVGSWQ